VPETLERPHFPTNIHASPRALRNATSGVIFLHAIPVAVLLILAYVVSRHGQLPYPDARFHYWDHYRYIAMSQHPFSADPLVRGAPFGWRILTPLVVHILPLPVTTSFWLVTLCGLIGATLALEWFLHGLGLQTSDVVWGALAFVCLGATTGFALWTYLYVDSLAYALLALVLACAVQRQGLLLLVTTVLLALAKETAIFGAVFAVAWAVAQRDRSMTRWAVGALAACIVVLAALRYALPTDYSLLGSMHEVFATTGTSPSKILARLVLATAGTWTILLPLAVLQLLHPPRIARSPAFILLVVLSTAQFLVALNIERTVGYAFPAIIAASAFEVKYLAERLKVGTWIMWVLALACELLWFVYDAGFPLSHYPAPLKALAFAFVGVAAIIVGLFLGRLGQFNTPTRSSASADI